MTQLLIATPTYTREVCVEFLGSAFATAQDMTLRGIKTQLHVLSGMPFIDLARNRIVDHFLHKTDASDLLFIDADQGWDYKAIPRLLNYTQEIVIGLPPCKTNDTSYCCTGAMTGVIEDTLFQCLEGPTGFMRLKRSVFAKLDKAYPELKPVKGVVPYFQVRDGGSLGEDMFFSRLWAGIGEFFWIDSDITFTHRGSKVWEGNFYDHAIRTGVLRS